MHAFELVLNFPLHFISVAGGCRWIWLYVIWYIKTEPCRQFWHAFRYPCKDSISICHFESRWWERIHVFPQSKCWYASYRGRVGQRSHSQGKQTCVFILFLTNNYSSYKFHYLQARIFHYGSISLIAEPCRSAHLAAMEIAKKAGCILSYDPNLRLPLWPSADAARKGILSIWDQADVIKVINFLYI